MKLSDHIRYIIHAHQQQPQKLLNAYRLWDKNTPYSIHPLWCAMTILTETQLPKALREEGHLTLLYHDILEDTKAKLPTLPDKVKKSIRDMTFDNGIDQEIARIWHKQSKIRLFKLYDKISNLLDASWMPPELHKKYIDYTRKLLQDVEQNFGSLNIVKIAHAFVDQK